MGFVKRRVRKHLAPLKRRARRQARDTAHRAATRVCPDCRQRVRPFHTCAPGSDFRARRRRQAAEERRRKRKAAAAKRAARRRQAAADRRARDRARKRAAKKRPAPRRRTGDSHEPGSCGDRDCLKYGCVAYWRGMDECPGPHEGE